MTPAEPGLREALLERYRSALSTIANTRPPREIAASIAGLALDPTDTRHFVKEVAAAPQAAGLDVERLQVALIKHGCHPDCVLVVADLYERLGGEQG